MSTNVVSLITELDRVWNTHDLEKILSFYSDDFELTSRHVRDRLGISDGTLRGKTAVRAWWRKVLDKFPDFSTELVSVADGVDSVAYIFRSSHSGEITSSVFFFDAAGKIRKEIYHG